MATSCGTYTIPSWGTDLPGTDVIGSGLSATSGLQPDFDQVINNYISHLSDAGFTCVINSDAVYKERSLIEDMNIGDDTINAAIGCGVCVGFTTTEITSAAAAATSSGLNSELISYLKTDDAKLGDYGLVMAASNGVANGQYALVPASLATSDSATSVSYTGGTTTADTTSTSTSSTATAVSTAYWVLNNTSSISATGMALTGVRALINDEPIYNTIKTYANGAMRSFCTAPDGSFVAFYPDKWGKYVVKDTNGNDSESAYLSLSPMEMTDFTLQQSDANFTSHVYVHGVYATGTSGTDVSMWNTSKGYVSVESRTQSAETDVATAVTGSTDTVSDDPSELLTNILNIPEGQEYYYSPAYLYQHYGARPYTEVLEDTLQFPVGSSSSSTSGSTNDSDDDLYTKTVNSNQLMLFLQALYIFMEKWSSMFISSITMTFMPELFPGMRIKIQDIYDKDGNARNISVYCESVSHSFSYESGFETTATVSCPNGDLVPGLVNVKYTGGN